MVDGFGKSMRNARHHLTHVGTTSLMALSDTADISGS